MPYMEAKSYDAHLKVIGAKIKIYRRKFAMKLMELTWRGKTRTREAVGRGEG